MSVYLVLCLLLAYPARLCVLARRQGRSAQRVALAMSCVVLWFFMAMRAQTVGVDTKYYVCIYQQFPQISWKELFNAQLYPTPRRTWELDLEPGYRLLNKLLSIYLPAPQWITVANSALIIALLYRWLRRESPNAMLSIWLYLTLGVYQTEMNVARNAIAILLGYTAFHWIKERKLAPYFLQILMAVSFHKSAVVFLPLYWLVNRRWKYRHVLWQLASWAQHIRLWRGAWQICCPMRWQNILRRATAEWNPLRLVRFMLCWLPLFFTK